MCKLRHVLSWLLLTVAQTGRILSFAWVSPPPFLPFCAIHLGTTRTHKAKEIEILAIGVSLQKAYTVVDFMGYIFILLFFQGVQGNIQASPSILTTSP